MKIVRKLQRFCSNNVYFLLRNLVVLVFLFCYFPAAHSAQLINSIPAKLNKNWHVCLHFESQPPECSDKDLPEAIEQIPNTVKYQSYIKDFVISSDLKKQALGLWLRVVDEVDRVYINGEQVGKTGEFLPAFETGFRHQRLYFIPNEILKYNQFNRLEIQTFSSRSLTGIQVKPPMLGDFLKYQHKLQERDYAYIIVTALLSLLTIFPIFYFIVVKGNYETLYFMFFLVAFALLSLARSQMPAHLGLDLSSVFKLETFMLNAGVISATLFAFHFFELEIRRIYAAGLYLLGLAALAIIIWPYPAQVRLLTEFNYLLIIGIGFLVIGSALIIAVHKQRKYAWPITLTYAFGWSILCYDAMMLSTKFINFELVQRPSVVPVCAAIISVIFTLTLTHKYWHYFKGSTYDHLTGTLLRPAFFQRLSEEMQRCNRGDGLLLVAVIDIQQAKKISINYGYSIGNHLLTTVSNSLTKVLRPYDLICRFSDEQFCIASSITDRQFAESSLQRIYEELINIQQPINKDIELYVDARIGGVIYNKELHLSVSHIVQDANYALSKAKSQSKQSYLLEQSALVQAI